ncbi:hypothetical protein V8F33_014115 [Rhypophila sp. PSN 637]
MAMAEEEGCAGFERKETCASYKSRRDDVGAWETNRIVDIGYGGKGYLDPNIAFSGRVRRQTLKAAGSPLVGRHLDKQGLSDNASVICQDSPRSSTAFPNGTKGLAASRGVTPALRFSSYFFVFKTSSQTPRDTSKTIPKGGLCSGDTRLEQPDNDGLHMGYSLLYGWGTEHVCRDWDVLGERHGYGECCLLIYVFRYSYGN